MQSQTPVEIADRVSRRRSIGVAIAAAVFLLVQLVSRPFFNGGGDPVSRLRIDMWAVNAGFLLLVLASGGGLIYSRRVRSLMNDEVSRNNYRTAVIAGYWIAMAVAMGVFFLSRLASLTAQEAVYLIVTPSVATALLAFSYLEHRAHRDA